MIGRDDKTDLAVLKIAATGALLWLRWAAHGPQVGEWVVAIGNPLAWAIR